MDLKAPPPISGGTLLALSEGGTAVASDPDRDAVYVVDLASATLTSTIALQPGDEPGRLVEDGAGHVHVALRRGGALVTIDPASGSIVERRAACPAPRGVAWDPAADLIWVACATGELVAFPSTGGAAAQSFVLQRDLRDVFVEDDGTLVVSVFRAAELLRVARDGSILRTDAMPSVTSGTPRVAWRTVPAAHGATLTVHQEHSLAALTTDVPGAYGSFTAAGSITSGVASLLDANGSAVISFILPAVLPVDIALSPDGTEAIVAAAGNGYVPSLSDLLLVETNGTAPPSDDTFYPVNAGQVGSFAPGGKGTSNLVDAGGATAGLTPLEGGAPATIVVSSAPSGTKLPTAAGEQAIAVAFDPANELLVQTREPATLRILDSNHTSWKTVPLSPQTRGDTGHALFHSAAGALIACASCHPEGGDDGHVWDLDNDARRTPSLRGTIAGTAPYHWPGDEADMPTLIEDVFTNRMSGLPLSADSMSHLTSWVEAIPAPPAPTWVDPAAASRGQALFASTTTQCATCHSGPKLTNNATVDVGTGGVFQVPPLTGVGWRTPLLHDGCAASIADRFTVCATSGHGSTASLSVDQISDLTAYLETL